MNGCCSIMTQLMEWLKVCSSLQEESTRVEEEEQDIGTATTRLVLILGE